MAFHVLLVDDSTFFRRRVKEILEQDPDLRVIDDASNGRDGVSKAISLKPDVVVMDVEMPVLDGISAVRQIMQKAPVPILMFSSLTHEGASATLDSLEAGALDFIPKNFEDIAQNRQHAIEQLQGKVKALAAGGTRLTKSTFVSTPTSPGATKPTRMFMRSSGLLSGTQSINSKAKSAYKILAIGASTGGPVAVQSILTELPADFPYPVILVQHMPGTFTKAFAERLDRTCKLKVSEAAGGEILQAGCVYLAPGGKQMLLEAAGLDMQLQIKDGDDNQRLTYKPSVDLTFSSVAKVCGGKVLAIILTGMGSDGREGCRALKAQGAKIWAQDEKSCVVYGMPQAVTQANLSERNIALKDFAEQIKDEMLS